MARTNPGLPQAEAQTSPPRTLSLRTREILAVTVLTLCVIVLTTVMHLYHTQRIVLNATRSQAEFVARQIYFQSAHALSRQPGKDSRAVLARDAELRALLDASVGYDPSLLKGCGDRLVMFGCVDPSNTPPEPLEVVVSRIRSALRFVQQERLLIAPDCGLVTISRDLARRKMELLVEAGLSPVEVITAATKNGALALRKLDELGTIEAGKRADLLLLNANPLEDVRNFRKIDQLMLNGEWIERTTK